MSTAFLEYVRSSAFRLDLSERQIDALLDVAGIRPDPSNLNLGPYKALERRGLVEWCHAKGPALTEPGELVVRLLGVSGYFEEAA